MNPVGMSAKVREELVELREENARLKDGIVELDRELELISEPKDW